MNSKPKLLYAEDNRLTAKEMTEILEEEGYEVVTTYSGDEAWETFQRISPDLVLLDFRMPGLNGLEVFEHIRQANAEIPVLILSSYNEYCVPSLKSGTADFIRKVSGWANTSCRFDFSQERSLCLSYVYVQW